MPSEFLKNVAGQRVTGTIVTDAGAKVTASAKIVLTLDGGAQANGTGTLTHLGNGQWDYAFTQAETNADVIGFYFDATTNDGFGSAGTIYTALYALTVDANGRIDVGSWLGQAVTLNPNNVPNVAVKEWEDSTVATSGGLPDVNTKTITTDAVNAAALATDAVTEIVAAIPSDTGSFQISIG